MIILKVISTLATMVLVVVLFFNGNLPTLWLWRLALGLLFFHELGLLADVIL